MGSLTEYTLLSIDGVVENSPGLGFISYRDDAYLRDGLGQLISADAMIYGRKTYEIFARMWPGRDHPWAARLNSIPKYVFSSTLEETTWQNSILVREDAVETVRHLKTQKRSLLIYGHGKLGESLLRAGLTDVIDLSIHPVIAGKGGGFFRDGQAAKMKLAGVKTFSKIVKLSFERQPT